jgi:demethylmenaquinone methyltransferase/2-methoxy-6-polyprenyl-1,4-benzoquinol methylase
MAKSLKDITPYDSGSAKKDQVATMFDNIAHKYDFLNHFLSMGIDKRWRKRAIQLLKEVQPAYILDVATGTGDLAFSAAKALPEAKILGVDISNEMMNVGRKKAIQKGLAQRVDFSLADSENLPFEDETFDAVMVAFGVRNFENLQKGLDEMNRVLKTNGKIFILEFSRPRMFPFKQFFGFYFKYILPVIGKISSRDPRAYKYLFESVQAFPDYENFLSLMKKAGFNSNKWEALSLGICSIYTGEK